MMDMYKIVCPYCKHEYVPPVLEEWSGIAYEAMICSACEKPFVKQVTWTTAYVSYALVGVEQLEEEQETVEAESPKAPEEKEDTAILKKGWCRVPGTGATYYPTPMHVSLQYQNCSPACIGWDDIEYLLSIGRENRPREIARTLLDKGLARQKLAVRMFLKAIEHDRIPHWRTL